MKKLRTMLILAIALAAAGTVFAGGGGDGKAQSGGTAKTLNVVLSYSKEKTVLYECLDQFTKETGIALNIQYMPLSDVRKQINIMVAGNSLPDVIDVDGTDTYTYAKMGILADITGRVTSELETDKFYDDVMSFSRVDGRYYGLPFTSNNVCLYYNKELLSRAGVAKVPETWDELLAACERIKNNTSAYGFAVSAGQNTDTPFHFFPVYYQAGGGTGDTIKLDSPEAIRALNYYRTLLDRGYMPVEVATYNAADIANQFAAGNIAMMFDGPWRLASVQRDAGFEFGIAELPAGPAGKASVLGGHNWVVVDNENVNASWEFIKFMNRPDIMAKYSEAENYIPARKDVAESSAYFSRAPINTFITMAANAKAKPVMAFSKLNDIMTEMVQSVVIGTRTPEQATRAAGNAYEAAK
ncbi:ABC transporter substrate-binding protein [Breznakiella homolactica]|uniref:Sugar ABC transporter substrate-binding protein n=1 Tax=Breznakiella homolactica TaxID=2798577 RepID=A0A7T7XMN2_9SPIR|nr:sugar ABC transporter substrate-binding protein [Breznakiella homolactica]QQO09174.1 sugar ABC transporter substrate-binding protein [Breznakiella homolactica]